jgi:hypothetical protein
MLPAQHWSPPAVQFVPSGLQATPPQMVSLFPQVDPVVQHGRSGSQATPSRTQAPTQKPFTHPAFEQQGLTGEQSAPSGMHAGCGCTQTPPLEQTKSEQHGWLASHKPPRFKQVAQMPLPLWASSTHWCRSWPGGNCARQQN